MPPPDLLAQVDSRSVRARLVLADGRGFGSLSPRRAIDPEAKTRRVALTGPGELDHAQLTLQVDTPLLAKVQARIGWVLSTVTAAAVLLIAGGLWFGVRRALAPLDSMTRLAREIAQGGRGRRLSPSRTDNELGRTASAFDEMLDALEGAEARAQASERRLRAFVGDAAHELRTPVAGIRAIAEAVLHQPADADPEERQRMQALLVREAQRAGRLVDELLDLARIDAGLRLRCDRVDLYGLAATHLERMRTVHSGTEFRLTGGPAMAVADAERIGQVLVNVLDNACRAAGPDGTVTVHIGSAGEVAEVRVLDTGPGVPPAERERIFDRLVRLDSSRDHRFEGSGLGLAIARGIARAHGGDLVCEEPRAGSAGAEFVLRLPAAA
nr:HAMP domain-containing sensor histidine kinase [Nocardia transvalensis]